MIDIKKIKPNPGNPRTIKDDKFKKLVESVKSFPEMMDARPIVCNKEMMILGGNMRYRVSLELGIKQVPVIVVDWPIEKQREFIIKDNVGFGDWDWALIADEWGEEPLEDWGLDVPGFDANADNYNEDFSLPDGDKAPFQQMTFTLADEQATVIKNAIDDIKGTDEYKYAETMGNENSNGNALYLIVASWAGQRK